MAGKIIGAFCCFLCAAPFFAIAALGKSNHEPITFWSGDTSLRGIVTDVPAYNREMAALYRKYAAAFLLAGAALVAAPAAGAIILSLNCTLGLYLLYRGYKKILKQYSSRR